MGEGLGFCLSTIGLGIGLGDGGTILSSIGLGDEETIFFSTGLGDEGTGLTVLGYEGTGPTVLDGHHDFNFASIPELVRSFVPTQFSRIVNGAEFFSLGGKRGLILLHRSVSVD